MSSLPARPLSASQVEPLRSGDLTRDFSEQVFPALERELTRATVNDPGLPAGLEDALRRAVGVPGGGGRRWRPLLTLATARACGREIHEILSVAVAVELTHTASLVLDDLPCMDDAGERRGLQATHRRVGSAGAILLAIGLLARSAELLATAPRGGADLAGAWGRSFGLSGMAGGQAVDVTGAFQTGGHARRLHRKKTTDLSSFAVWAGATAAGAGDRTRQALYRFGRDLGWAYQLADDARDLEEDSALGRGPGGRRPQEQAYRLLGRARRRLREAPGLTTEGRQLLDELGGQIVGEPSPTRDWNQGDSTC